MASAKKIGSDMKASSSKAGSSNINDVSSVLKKRPADELTKPKDWSSLIRRVFTTKGEGTFRESVNVKSGGPPKDLFWITGTTVNNQVLVLQVWGPHAKKFADLFQNLAKPDFEPTLWVLPVPKATGLFFREAKANSYQQKNQGAAFCFTLDFGQKDAHPFPALTGDAYPSLFDWSDGNYELNGVTIPHYRRWGEILETNVEEIDDLASFVPPMRTYHDASPHKESRVECQFGIGTKKGSSTTDLDFDEA